MLSTSARRRLSAFLLTISSVCQPAQAQTNANAYVGAWSLDTGGMAGKCVLRLSPDAMMGKLRAATEGCLGTLAFVSNWSADPSGSVQLEGMNGVVATLQPSRGGMAGRMSDGSLFSARPLDGQRLGRRQDRPRGSDWRGDDGRWDDDAAPGDCYLRQDTGRCADPDDIPPPRDRRFVRSIGPLNVRSKEDMSSPVVTYTEAGECFMVYGCRDTRWGPRCEVRWGDDQVGYTIKYLEQNGRNYVAFLNRCD